MPTEPKNPSGASTINGTDAPDSQRKPGAAEKSWEEKTLAPTLEKSPERASKFTTVSSYPIRRLYTPADLPNWNEDRDLGLPGEPPYTRGIHPTMYRDASLDHAAIRGIWHRRRYQSAISLFAGARTNRAFSSLRFTHLDGL